MPRNMPGERGPDWWENKIKDRLDHLAEKLDLRPEQVQALGQTQLGAARQMHKHRQDVEAAREELHRLVTVVPSDRDSIQAAIRRLSSRQAVVDSFVTTTMMTEMEILDADQRAQYLEMLSLRKHGRQGRGGRRMGRAAHRPFNDK